MVVQYPASFINLNMFIQAEGNISFLHMKVLTRPCHEIFRQVQLNPTDKGKIWMLIWFGRVIWKLELNGKLLVLFTFFVMFWAIIKTFKQLWHAFICVSGTFIAYFKGLIHFSKQQFRKVLLSPNLIYCFLSGFVRFC